MTPDREIIGYLLQRDRHIGQRIPEDPLIAVQPKTPDDEEDNGVKRRAAILGDGFATAHPP
jgi:hypothetical protein